MIIRVIFGLIFFTIALGVSMLLLGVLTINRALPHYEGEVEVLDIKQPVEIYRDSFAIAHIYGATENDCYYGLGYAQAQERLFQMDFTRRIGYGRLSEVLGPHALMIDQWARTIGFARIAQQMVKKMSPATKKTLEAYTSGINACIRQRNGKYGFEFDALSYKPEPWKVEDCLVIARLMSWEMNFSFWTDAAFSDIALKVTPEQLAALYPTYPDFAPTTLEGPLPRTTIRTLTPKPVFDTISIDSFVVQPDTNRPTAELTQYHQRLAAALKTFTISPGGGSNAFAIGPKRTASKGAILENDLHLALRTPARFFMTHLESKDGLSCAGFTIPGVPIFTSGRNKKVSWGVTNGMIDECDYVMLEMKKGASSYKTRSGDKYFTTFVENITVKGTDGMTSHAMTVRMSEFGPVISDLYTFELARRFSNDSLQPIGAQLQTQIGRTPMALHWNGSYTLGDEVGAFLKLPKATKAGADMMTEYATPCLNLVMADAAGQITYNLIGRIPKRSGNEERLLMPRHSDDSDGVWQSFVTTPSLPRAIDPQQGFLHSANNPATRDRSTLPLSMNWEPPARSERLYQMLISQNKNSIKEINTIATDYLSLYDRDVLLPPLLRVMRGAVSDTVNYGRVIEEALDYIENWGGVQEAEDVATTILQVYMIRLLVHAVHDELGPELFSEFTYINNVPVRTLAAIIDDEWNILWDDVRSPQRESRDTIIRHAFFDAVKQCQVMLGNDVRRWNWGRLHSLKYRHPFSAVSPEVGTIGDIDQGSASGSLTSVVQSSYTFWDPFKMIVGPSMRFYADMSTQQVHLVQPTGNSGDLFSPHYRDMARMFRDGGFTTFSLGAPLSTWKKLVLTPAR